MRRNLSASQRAVAAAQAWAMAEEEGKTAKRGEIGEKRSPKVGDLIKDPRSHFARMFSVGKGYIEQARAVLSYSPELAAAVRDGIVLRQSPRVLDVVFSHGEHLAEVFARLLDLELSGKLPVSRRIRSGRFGRQLRSSAQLKSGLVRMAGCESYRGCADGEESTS